MPPKLKDPGEFDLECLIGGASITRGVCDLGASVSIMPLHTYKRIRPGEIEPTHVVLEMADMTPRQPLGKLTDVPVVVEGARIPVDFMIMDTGPDTGQSERILGRPFLATAGAIIDARAGTVSLECGRVHIKARKPV